MDCATMVSVIMTIQHMEERGIFVKDHTIEDAIKLVEFNHVVDNYGLISQKMKAMDGKK